MTIPDAAFIAHYGKTQAQMLDESFERIRAALLEFHATGALTQYGCFNEFDTIMDDFEAKVKAAKRQESAQSQPMSD